MKKACTKNPTQPSSFFVINISAAQAFILSFQHFPLYQWFQEAAGLAAHSKR